MPNNDDGAEDNIIYDNENKFLSHINTKRHKKWLLRLNQIKERLEKNSVDEIILALSATIEGQTTALVIKDFFEQSNIKITQLAYGVPVGSEIHYLDDNTLGAALESRKNL